MATTPLNRFPRRAAGREEDDAKPADGVAVEGPELVAVRQGRQECGKHPENREGRDDPISG
jgi:hypothetical protein